GGGISPGCVGVADRDRCGFEIPGSTARVTVRFAAGAPSQTCCQDSRMEGSRLKNPSRSGAKSSSLTCAERRHVWRRHPPLRVLTTSRRQTREQGEDALLTRRRDDCATLNHAHLRYFQPNGQRRKSETV